MQLTTGDSFLRHAERDRDVDVRKSRRNALRPFDQADAVRPKGFGDTRIVPLGGVIESKKIKVIQV